MPWYTNPVMTRKVLDRIANRHPRTTIQELGAVLDYVTELIWRKQENYVKALELPRKPWG